jgi:hypothetical protein
MDLSAYTRQMRAQLASRAPAATVADPPNVGVALSAEALRLLAANEVVRRLHAIATAYPHLLNRLAEVWDVPESVECYLEGLLLTSRSDRRGFPPAVVTELTDLREKNRRRLGPVARDVWSEAMLR